jgi:hypothetical protein
MSTTPATLEEITFPAESAYRHNQQLRTFLQQVQPFVNKGTIQTIKIEVSRALDLPLDDSMEFAKAHFWALHQCWPYIHGIAESNPERKRMIQLYEQIRDLGVFPFTDKSAPAKSSLRYEFDGGALFARGHSRDPDDPIGVIIVAEDKPDLIDGTFAMRLGLDGELSIAAVEPFNNWDPLPAQFGFESIVRRQVPRGNGDLFYGYARRAASGPRPEDGCVTIMFGVMSNTQAQRLGIVSEGINRFSSLVGICSTEDCTMMARGLNLHQVFTLSVMKDLGGKQAYSTTDPIYTYAQYQFNLGLAQLDESGSQEQVETQIFDLHKEHLEKYGEGVPSQAYDRQFRIFLQHRLVGAMSAEDAVCKAMESEWDLSDQDRARTRQKM